MVTDEIRGNERINLKLVRCPRSLDPTLVTLPSMSLIPFAPFGGDEGGRDDLFFAAPMSCHSPGHNVMALGRSDSFGLQVAAL